MLNNFFLEQIRKNFPFEPTDEQHSALEKLSNFLFDRNNDSLFLLKGYAGTGKSSLAGAIVKTMNELNQKAVLLAPTGRAAKVFAAYAGQNAYTIHKKIYRQKVFSNEPTGFVPADNLHTHTLFIVDEASMISNGGLDSFSFGSGRLLDDLIHYVYSGEGCRLILMGDSAQLPPVSETESPALDAEVLKGYGMEIHTITLTQVVRQAEASGILMNATNLRKMLKENQTDVFPQIRTKNYPDVKVVGGEDLIETLSDAYHRDSLEETIVVARSNKQTGIFNNGIRNRILSREEELSSGDLLMVAKNNYYWAKDEKSMDFIANGDLMEVLRVRKVQELYGFRFCDVTVRFPDYEVEMDLKILPETLHTDSPALPKELNDKLFYNILEDYADISGKREKMKRMKENPYYNVVQVKYAYAVTCHKAQGGQWKNVFLDLSYVPKEYLGIDFYRWLYTAFTRATERIYLINPAKELLEN
ncbi:ATP-dependent endonuclease [Bacteroidia bacterium]|nr:ATP-dependent endonuclease [Bacteroidia bacterium]GHT85277.1 ATP-dependent endonuclease [Bacteroidia bacterium]